MSRQYATEPHRDGSPQDEMMRNCNHPKEPRQSETLRLPEIRRLYFCLKCFLGVARMG